MSETKVSVPVYSGPRWEFDSGLFMKHLDTVASFPSGANIFLRLSTVEGLVPGTRALWFYATNRDYVLDTYLPLTNESPFDPDRVYFLKINVLVSLAKIYPSFVFTFGPKGEIYFHSEVAHYEMKPVTVDKFDEPEVIYAPSEERMPFSLPRFALSSAKRMLDYATKLVDNKVSWSGIRFRGSFLVVSFDFLIKGDFPPDQRPAFFRKADISLLSVVSGITDDIRYSMDAHRFYLFYGTGCLSFLLVPGKEEHYAPIVTKEKYGEVAFDIPLLSKVLSFSKMDQMLFSIVFVPAADGKSIEAKVDQTSRFRVGSGTVPPHGFSLQVDSLRKILGVLPDGADELHCRVHKDGAVFLVKTDEVTYTYAVGKIDTTRTASTTVEVIDRLAVKKN